MKEIIDLQEKLTRQYGYKKLPNKLSAKVRSQYQFCLPDWVNLYGNSNQLITLKGTPIADGYKRTVIGDYGAFLEISDKQAIKGNMKVKEGQEFRYGDSKYNVKYLWLTAIDDSDIKIYYQVKEVSYADYRPKMFYVSPYEINAPIL